MPNTINLSAVNSILSKIAFLDSADQNQFLKHLVDIIHAHIDIYFLMFFLLDADGEWVSFRTCTSEEVTNLLSTRGFRLKVNTAASINKISLMNKKVLIYSLPTEARNSLDICLETEQEPNYFSPLLPETRAELSLPLRFDGKLIGAWRISSSRDDGFELEDIIHFQLLADQITIKLSM